MVRTAEKIILYKDAAPMITPFSMPITVGIYQEKNSANCPDAPYFKTIFISYYNNLWYNSFKQNFQEGKYMKLIYAIINEDDTESVVEELNKADYKVTKLSTTGGFLKRGNTTLMICTEDENLKDVTSRIECVCGKRHKVEYDVPCINYSAGAVGSYFPAWYGGTKKEIEVGGAIIFAVDVCYYEKI